MVSDTSPHPVGLCAQAIGLTAQGQPLLLNIDLHLLPGQVGAILGPNGAGKSTLLGVLSGLKPPHTGGVWIDAQALTRAQLPALGRRRAVLPQDTHIAFDFSAREVVELGRYPHRLQPSADESAIVEQAMALTHTRHLAQRRMAWLSGGERLRVQLARVLAQIWEAPSDGSSRWLLLDEPTAALDLQHQHAVLTTVRDWAHRHGVGVLMVLHDLNLALRYTDRVWVIRDGQLHASGSTSIVLDPALVADVWQIGVSDTRAPCGQAQLLFAQPSVQGPVNRVGQLG